jgi:hypothetical protein
MFSVRFDAKVIGLKIFFFFFLFLLYSNFQTPVFSYIIP